MTIFLCILTFLSLGTAKFTAKGSAWAVPVLYALHVVLVLGLATLAVWCWSQP